MEDLLMRYFHLDILTELATGIEVTVKPRKVTACDIYPNPVALEEDVARRAEVYCELVNSTWL